MRKKKLINITKNLALKKEGQEENQVKVEVGLNEEHINMKERGREVFGLGINKSLYEQWFISVFTL